MNERQDWQRLNWIEDIARNLPVSIEKTPKREEYVVRIGRVDMAGSNLREAIDAGMEAVPEPA